MSDTPAGEGDIAPGNDRVPDGAGDLDRSVLVPADLGFDTAAEGLSAFSTTAVSPDDHGDFNLSLTTARRHEQHSGRDEERAAHNLAVLRRLCGRSVARLHQVHSARVIDLDKVVRADDDEDGTTGTDAASVFDDAVLAPLARTDADALLTTRRGVALAILTGDCVPLLFADRARGVFAAAHSGRLGTEKDIAGAVVSAMTAKGAKASDIHVWIGPHICGDCYETGEKIAAQFEEQFPGCSTVTRFGGPGVDLGKAIRLELAQAGVLSGHVVDAVETDGVSAANHTPTEDHRLMDSQNAADSAGRSSSTDKCGATAGRQPRMCCTLEDTRFYSYRGFTLSGDTRRDGRFYTVLAL